MRRAELTAAPSTGAPQEAEAHVVHTASQGKQVVVSKMQDAEAHVSRAASHGKQVVVSKTQDAKAHVVDAAVQGKQVASSIAKQAHALSIDFGGGYSKDFVLKREYSFVHEKPLLFWAHFKRHKYSIGVLMARHCGLKRKPTEYLLAP